MKLQISLKLSKLCNLRCVYCYEYEELAQKERMSLESLDYFVKNLTTFLEQSGKYDAVEFILHGGEPLILPHDYLRQVCGLPEKYLTPKGFKYGFSCPSNLFKISDQTLQLLQELKIMLGVSLDVAGNQRLTLSGVDSQDQVLVNLQRLVDAKIPFGVNTVLHALNLDDSVKVYHFYNELGIDYRILPIFSQQEEVPERMRHLAITREQALDTLKKVALEQFSAPTRIKVSPIYEYLVAATLYVLGENTVPFDPRDGEWTLVVNTNGDMYNNGDLYQPEGFMGNVFRQPLAEVLSSPEHDRVVSLRMERLKICLECPFDSKCSRIPMVEALSSERSYDESGNLKCGVAQPFIEFLVEEIHKSKTAGKLIDFTRVYQATV